MEKVTAADDMGMLLCYTLCEDMGWLNARDALCGKLDVGDKYLGTVGSNSNVVGRGRDHGNVEQRGRYEQSGKSTMGCVFFQDFLCEMYHYYRIWPGNNNNVSIASDRISWIEWMNVVCA